MEAEEKTFREELEELNVKVREIMIRYDGLIKAGFLILLAIMFFFLIKYFIEVHLTFSEIARDPQQWCWNNYPVRIALTD